MCTWAFQEVVQTGEDLLRFSKAQSMSNFVNVLKVDSLFQSTEFKFLS